MLVNKIYAFPIFLMKSMDFQFTGIEDQCFILGITVLDNFVNRVQLEQDN